jgi:hypothetical protein
MSFELRPSNHRQSHPNLSCEHFLLMLIDRKTRASDCKLNDEKTEQNDHVEEETDLMMLGGSIETEE